MAVEGLARQILPGPAKRRVEQGRGCLGIKRGRPVKSAIGPQTKGDARIRTPLPEGVRVSGMATT